MKGVIIFAWAPLKLASINPDIIAPVQVARPLRGTEWE